MSESGLKVFADYKVPAIQHENDKARKEFIMDCVFIGAGISVLYVALEGEFSEGVASLHKNKDRKKIAKIKSAYDFLKSEQSKLYNSLSNRDLQTIQAKTHKSGSAFISHISTTDRDINLEILAVNILRYGFMRSRKTEIHDSLKVFSKWMFLYKNIVKNIKAGGINETVEGLLAKNFVSSVKY